MNRILTAIFFLIGITAFAQLPNKIPTIDKVLDNYFEAIGGKKDVFKVNSMKLKYRDPKHDLLITIESLKPNLLYYVSLIESKYKARITKFNGEKGLLKEPNFMYPMIKEDITEEKSKSKPFVEFSLYKIAKSITIEKIKKKEYYLITDIFNNKYYYDIKTGLKYREIFLKDFYKVKGNFYITYLKYKEVNGILIPSEIGYSNKAKKIIFKLNLILSEFNKLTKERFENMAW